MSSAGPQSNLEQNKALLARWFAEVWNESRTETIKALYSENCVLHDGAETIRGVEEFTQFHDNLRKQYSDFSITPIVTLAEGDLVAMHWSASFRHKELNKWVKVTGMDIARVQNGKFVEAWQNWDTASVTAQLAA
jgi:predicted SnoaL-like aldol condensation-catalyzing enzyme